MSKILNFRNRKEKRAFEKDKKARKDPQEAQRAEQERLKERYNPDNMTKEQQNKHGALQALQATHNLLHQGLFPGNSAETVKVSQDFIAELHRRTLQELDKMLDEDPKEAGDES